jgi:hypothetical protein
MTQPKRAARKRATSRPKIVTCRPLETPGGQDRAPLWRAEVFFHGLDLTGASYRAAVFLNRPHVRHDTPEDAEHGYAGAFFLFGKGGCFGDPEHCSPRPRRGRFDHRLAHHSHPTVRSVDITEALRRELAAGAEEILVSLVPELADTAGIAIDADLQMPIKFDQVGLVTYDAYAPAAERAQPEIPRT